MAPKPSMRSGEARPVKTGPGAMALTRTPTELNSAAQDRVVIASRPSGDYHSQETGGCPPEPPRTSKFPVFVMVSLLWVEVGGMMVGFASRCRRLGGNEGHQSPLYGDQGRAGDSRPAGVGRHYPTGAKLGASQFCVVQKAEGVRQLALLHEPASGPIAGASASSLFSGWRSRPGSEDFQRQGQVALVGKRGRGVDECLSLVPGE